MASDKECFALSYVFSKEDKPSSLFSKDDNFIHDYLGPLSSTSP